MNNVRAYKEEEEKTPHSLKEDNKIQTPYM